MLKCFLSLNRCSSYPGSYDGLSDGCVKQDPISPRDKTARTLLSKGLGTVDKQADVAQGKKRNEKEVENETSLLCMCGMCLYSCVPSVSKVIIPLCHISALRCT